MAVLKLLFVLFTVSGVVLASEGVQNDDVPDEVKDSDDHFPGSRPESRTAGLEKLYSMAVNFIDDMVIPYSIGDLIVDYNMDSFKDFAEPEFYDDWKVWGKNYIGLAVCLAVGVLFIVLMPFIGIMYCCCRCCCDSCLCCCCKTPKEGKTSKCKRYSCGFFLFGFTTLMLASGLCVFLTQDELVTELGPDGFFKDVTTSIDTLSIYVNNTMDQIEEIAIDDLFKTVDEVVENLEGIPDYVIDALNNATQAEDLLKSLEQFVNDLQPLSDNFKVMNTSTVILQALQDTLENELSSAQTQLDDVLHRCINVSATTSECNDLSLKLANLTSGANFTNIDPTLAAAAAIGIDDHLSKGLQDTVKTAVEAFYNITDEVRDVTDEAISDIKEELDDLKQTITDEWGNITKSIRDFDLDGIKDRTEEIGEEVHEYVDEYYPYFYLGIVGIIFAIALFNYLGLGFGGLCSQPTKPTTCNCGKCTSRQGSCFLLTSVSLIFFLGWLLMIVTLVFFAVGGGTEFLLCRHLVVYDDTMQQIERLAFNEADLDFNISIREVIDDCKNNTALYQALKLAENGFNVSEKLDLSKTDIYEKADELKNITVDLGTVEIVSDSLNETMIMIDGLLDLVTFDEYNAALGKDIVQTDVREFIHDLRAAASNVTDKTVGDDLANEADSLEAILNNTIIPMEEEKDILHYATTNAESINSGTSAADLMIGLTKAERGINEEAPVIISEVIGYTTDDVLNHIETFIGSVEDSIIKDLAGCRPIYDTLKTMTYSVCIYFLYPFNSVWFCVGWFLFCGVFTLIFGTKMAGYYRQIPEKETTGYPHNNTGYPNRAYDPTPDYDDEPVPVQISKQHHHKHPGVYKPPKGASNGQHFPPPDYATAMKDHSKQAKDEDKKRKQHEKNQKKQTTQV